MSTYKIEADLAEKALGGEILDGTRYVADENGLDRETERCDQTVSSIVRGEKTKKLNGGYISVVLESGRPEESPIKLRSEVLAPEKSYQRINFYAGTDGPQGLTKEGEAEAEQFVEEFCDAL